LMSNFKSYFSLTCVHEAIFFKSFFEVVYFYNLADIL
jgi:hypothetical protein